MTPESTASTRRPDLVRTVAWYVVLMIGVAFCISPWRSPGAALAWGIIAAIAGLTDPSSAKWMQRIARVLLQTAVVLLGFKMDLAELARAGAQGLLFAIGTIVFVFVSGAIIGRWLKTTRNVTILVSSGTAICGGSAIAAVGPVIAASAAEMSVAIGTVFILNAAGLFVLPELGRWMHLSPAQFGTWAAVSIHDVSSVTGAAARFGGEALAIATAVKLSRAIWIAPVAAIAGWWVRRIDSAGQSEDDEATPRPAPIRVPMFILLFIAASAVRTIWPRIAPGAGLTADGAFVFDHYIKSPALALMSMSLLLIGLSLNRKTLAEVGWRAFALGVSLWVLISIVSLIVVRHTVA